MMHHKRKQVDLRDMPQEEPKGKPKEKPQRRPKEKNDNEVSMFLKTFIVVFVLTLAITLPLFTKVVEIGEMSPGNPDAPVLAELVDFETLIPTDSPFFEAFTNANRVNILVLGVDHHNLTDTIILASFDIDQKHMDLIWIPRDTYYYRGPAGDTGSNKINAAYRKNPVNSAIAVSEILMNIPINYYAEVTYEGVATIIDEMGGVPMDIPFNMRYNDPLDTPPLSINIPKGFQVLSGEQSVKFLRYRSGYPDAEPMAAVTQLSYAEIPIAARRMIGAGNLDRLMQGIRR